MDLGDKKAQGVADFAAAVKGNENNSRQEQPQRRQDGRKQAGACRDERRHSRRARQITAASLRALIQLLICL